MKLSAKYLAGAIAVMAAGWSIGGSAAISRGAQSGHQPAPTITVVVDETQAARRIAFVHEEIQVKPGMLALAYPKWIPGEHGPTGPIEQLAAIRIRAGNTVLPWTRDPDDIYKFQVEVPAGSERVSVDFDTLVVNTISDHQLLLAWNTVLLYPLGIDKRELVVEPSILLPVNWKQGSSLQVTSESGNRLDFAPLSIERLVDSPVLAGEFFRAIPLKTSWPAEMDVTGDSQAAVAKADDAHAVSLFTQLVEQDRALFGFRHWQTMHFLISQSAADPYDGLEHEDSPWGGMDDAALSKRDQLEKLGFPVLAHEQAHSWDGKYRRPAELYSKPDFQGPERTTLLWVYEGLTEYIGEVLAARAGFEDAAYLRDFRAVSTANLMNEAGRTSSALVDTATDNWVLRNAGPEWSSLRREEDYYDEGALMWLRADVLIRQRSHGRLSLDDFVRSFFGQRDTGPIVVPYTREDVESALSAILPYDWHQFFEARVYQVNHEPLTADLEAAGWQLTYNDRPNHEFYNETPGRYRGAYSIGMDVHKDGSIYHVLPNSPAYDAGLGPNMTVIAVDGQAYSSDALNQAIAHPRDGKISVIARNFDSLQEYEIRYSGGVRYPHLVPIPGRHDYLADILAPRSVK
jgi:predicted metalloprotease with PDZ domain